MVRTYHKPQTIFPLPILRWEVFSSSLLSSRSSHTADQVQPFIRPAMCPLHKSHGGGSPVSCPRRGNHRKQESESHHRNAERPLPVPLRTQYHLTKSLGWRKKKDFDSTMVCFWQSSLITRKGAINSLFMKPKRPAA